MAEEKTTTKKVTLDLEIDPKTTRGANPYQKIIHIAEAVDAWRIFPRIFISVYIYLLYAVVSWFMMLKILLWNNQDL